MEIQGVIDIKTIGIIFSSCFVPVAIAIFVRWKTGSFLTVWTRIWALFHGRRAPSTAFITEYIDSQTSVMQLVFSTGAKVRTEQHAKRAIEWHKRHDESLEDAVRCGPYFDWEAMQIDPTRKRKPGASVALIGSLFSIALFLLVIMVHDKLLVRMIATDTWFNVTEKYAQPLFSENRLLFAKCAGDLAKLATEGGFSIRNTKLICDIFGAAEKNEIESYFKKSFLEQQIIAGVYAFTCLLLMYLPVWTLMHQASANNMEKRARTRVGST